MMGDGSGCRLEAVDWRGNHRKQTKVAARVNGAEAHVHRPDRAGRKVTESWL